jgi:hypothetical protein
VASSPQVPAQVSASAWVRVSVSVSARVSVSVSARVSVSVSVLWSEPASEAFLSRVRMWKA